MGARQAMAASAVLALSGCLGAAGDEVGTETRRGDALVSRCIDDVVHEGGYTEIRRYASFDGVTRESHAVTLAFDNDTQRSFVRYLDEPLERAIDLGGDVDVAGPRTAEEAAELVGFVRQMGIFGGDSCAMSTSDGAAELARVLERTVAPAAAVAGDEVAGAREAVWGSYYCSMAPDGWGSVYFGDCCYAHDARYCCCYNRYNADASLYWCMINKGAPAWLASVYFTAVRIFAYHAWCDRAWGCASYCGHYSGYAPRRWGQDGS